MSDFAKDTNVPANDCISRQAAIDAIHGDADWLASQGSDWQVERMERDKSILQSLPSAQPYSEADIQKMQDLEQAEIQKAYELGKLDAESRWIPCSERLPEKDGRYLVTHSRWGAWAVDWNIWRNDPKPSWLWEQGVTAWMPLPEPYREEGTE